MKLIASGFIDVVSGSVSSILTLQILNEELNCVYGQAG